MSISFIVDADVPRVSVDEPCLCAQMAPVFGELFRGESTDWDGLRGYADPHCKQCGGTGVERIERDERPQVNFANENAYIVAQALGLDLDGGIGRMELATLRRGLIRARNVAVPAELRADELTERAIVRGYSRGDLDAALTRLQELVSAAQRLGATHILWS
jgi:hypothetical protein